MEEREPVLKHTGRLLNVTVRFQIQLSSSLEGGKVETVMICSGL